MSLHLPSESELVDLVWSNLELGLSAQDIQSAAREVSAIPVGQWYRCSYRNCNLLLVYGGDSIDERQNLNWLFPQAQIPSVIKIVERHIRPLFKRLPRIIVLHTSAQESMRYHIDCAESEVNSFQPKLRVILKGALDDLYFLQEDGVPLHVHPRGPSYYMSGAYAHSLQNRTDEDRYTLCLGNPWTYQDMSEELLKRLSIEQTQSGIFRHQLGNVDHSAYAKNVSLETLVPLRPFHVSKS